MQKEHLVTVGGTVGKGHYPLESGGHRLPLRDGNLPRYVNPMQTCFLCYHELVILASKTIYVNHICYCNYVI